MTDKKRVNALMAAFRSGGRQDDLGVIDDRFSSGRYDRGQWTAALDGATLVGHSEEYKAHLLKALLEGLAEPEALEVAYSVTGKANGYAV